MTVYREPTDRRLPRRSSVKINVRIFFPDPHTHYLYVHVTRGDLYNMSDATCTASTTAVVVVTQLLS